MRVWSDEVGACRVAMVVLPEVSWRVRDTSCKPWETPALSDNSVPNMALAGPMLGRMSVMMLTKMYLRCDYASV